MTLKYQLTGMTCSSCEVKVKSSLLKLPHITAVEVSKDNNEAIISMDSHIALTDLQNALDAKYHITASEEKV